MKRLAVLVLFVIAASLMRLLPHPPNFTPVTAIALFGGVYFNNRFLAIILPLVIMAISDMVIGFYNISYFVYGSFLLVSLLAIGYRKLDIKLTLLGSLLFFFVSNLGVWILGYPKTIEGFVLCYTLAIPFLGYSLLGDLFFSNVLKYSFNYVDKKWLTTVY
jgi:hypothetical protein